MTRRGRRGFFGRRAHTGNGTHGHNDRSCRRRGGAGTCRDGDGSRRADRTIGKSGVGRVGTVRRVFGISTFHGVRLVAHDLTEVSHFVTPCHAALDCVGSRSRQLKTGRLISSHDCGLRQEEGRRCTHDAPVEYWIPRKYRITERQGCRRGTAAGSRNRTRREIDTVLSAVHGPTQFRTPVIFNRRRTAPAGGRHITTGWYRLPANGGERALTGGGSGR